MPATVLEAVESLDAAHTQINVYPNPSTGKISIAANGIQGVKGELKIYNVLGKVVYQKPSFEIPASSNTSLNLNLSSGIYFIRISSDKVSAEKKIVIE